MYSVGAAVAYGTGPVLIKVALASGIAVWTFLSSRLVLAAVLLWVIAAGRRALARTSSVSAPYALGALALGALPYTAQLSFFALALERVSASLVVILFYTFPIVVAIVAVLAGRERLSPLTLVALTLGVCGVAAVAVAGDELRAEPLGVVFALGSACACACVVLGSDLLAEHVPPLRFAALLVSGASIAFLATVIVVGFDGSVTTSTWALVALVALIPGVLGTTFMLAGVGAIGPSLTSIILTLEPPVAMLIAWLALGEHLNLTQIAGGALILVAASLARRIAQPTEAEIEVHA